jgi:hypothetical protein
MIEGENENDSAPVTRRSRTSTYTSYESISYHQEVFRFSG